MLRVGLTGGVACGKSTVGDLLAKRGAHLLQADTLAHELYLPGTTTYEAIVNSFGREILKEDGRIDRPKLANVVFPDRISELNAIVHPAVIEAQNRWLEEAERSDPDGMAIVEAALLIEAGAASHFDKVIVVTCAFEQKVERYAKRAGISKDKARAEVERRSTAQFTDEEKARHADYLIDNSGTPAELEEKIARVWAALAAENRKPGPSSA